MAGIYQKPLRVYLLFAVLAFVGILSGLKLPISLYPNSSKPIIYSYIPYGRSTAKEFLENYGTTIESRLEAIDNKGLHVELVTSEYEKSGVSYQVEFKWGTDPKEALSEVQSLLNGMSSNWPSESREHFRVNYWAKSSGFIAISFYSEERDPDQLYKILEPVLGPPLQKVGDAEDAGLWNPNRKEIRLTLHPEAMASLGLFPRDIENALNNGLRSNFGGSVVVGQKKLMIKMPREVVDLKSLETLLVQTPKGNLVHLSEVAHIDLGASTGKNRIFKTSGAKSLILFSKPRTGGNVKRMAEEILQIVKNSMGKLPQDIHYKVLVDPSEFIRASIENVIHEVLVAAGLAVFVLFLFIGSLKNTITAAIEIPMSMVLAFILMNIFDMNLNLISLGGLALAAGMNVDASVVVMENIFRHFENAKGPFNPAIRFKIITRAVKEVSIPIVASTISTLVVFAPLAFTSDLTNAILGDLAKAVVFSHAFSMFVALIFVPTIRLQLMNREGESAKLPKAPLEKPLLFIERLYETSLRAFISSRFVKWLGMAAILSSLAVLLIYVVPTLKREIIGTPDTDWMILAVNTSGNTQIKEMETTVGVVENSLLESFGKDISYTFTQIHSANSGNIMARLKNKKDMDRVWKAMEEKFQNTPTLYYWVGPWNPAELPIPDPPQMNIVVKGGADEERMLLAEDLLYKLKESEPFPRIWSNPSTDRKEDIVLRPHLGRWPELQKAGARFLPYDLADIARVATEGRGLGDLSIDGEKFPLFMTFPGDVISTKEDLEAMPIGVSNKLIPLGAIVDVSLEKAEPKIHRENGRSLVVIHGKLDKGKEQNAEASLLKSKKIVDDYLTKDKKKLGLKTNPSVYIEDGLKELNKALGELEGAVFLSIGLIFFTLIFQFSSLVHTGIIMVAIPLGIFGGTLSLFIFGSTLSLNSVLGVILLNGIAVNNSIILVDFIRTLVDEGVLPREAAVLAARKRLRPILITSLTTILGMFPVALGLGDGGKILQPLGIAVAGGLWFSMIFTLYFVPLLEAMYLEKKVPPTRPLSSIEESAPNRPELSFEENALQ